MHESTPRAPRACFLLALALVLAGKGLSLQAVLAATTTTLTQQIAVYQDDGFQDGSNLTNSSVITFIGDNTDPSASYTGFRFAGVPVPAGATIQSAQLQLYATADDSHAIKVTFWGEASGNSAAFSSTSLPGGRAHTTSSISLNGPGPWYANNSYNFDVSSMVKEVVGRSDWASGHALSLIVKGTSGVAGNHRPVQAKSGTGATNSARLVIAYTPATATPAPIAVKTATAAPTAVKTATAAPTAVKTATAAPTAVKTATAAPTAVKTATSAPTAGKPATSAPTAVKTATPAPTASPAPTSVAPLAGIYVSTSGSDTSGNGSNASPYRTIQRGIDVALAGQTVWVRGGTYNEMVVINKSATAAQPITIKNYNGEQAIVDGFTQLGGWQQYSGNVYRAQFTRNSGKSAEGFSSDAVAMSTSPDGFSQSSDRRAQLYVDNTPDQSHWLKPVMITGGSPEYSAASIPAGTFATDAPAPPLSSGRYAGMTSYIYVNLANLSDANPNNHQMRIAGWESQFYFGPSAGYIVVRGLTLRGGMHATLEETASNITIDGNDVSLHKLRDIDIGHFGISNWTVTGNTIHDSEYEYVHIEADNSIVARNTMRDTIAPWSYWGSMGLNILGSSVNVLGNEVYNIKKNASNGHGGHGIMLESFGRAQNDTIQKNKVHNNQNHGIYVLDADYAVIRNNLVYDNGGYGVTMEDGAGDGSAHDNSVVDNTITHNANYGVALNGTCRNDVIRNNVLWANSNTIWNAGSNNTQDHNLTTSPAFVNESTRNLHISVASTARSAGTCNVVSDDYDGVVRPTSGSTDLGAYQYVP